MSSLEARELVLYRRCGHVLEVRLRDVSLARVFTYVRHQRQGHPVVCNFAHVKNLTIFAFDRQYEEDTEAYLKALSKLMGRGGMPCG